jgi:hypothetical protein
MPIAMLDPSPTPAADVLVRAIMGRDSIEPGFVVAIVRGVSAAPPTADALLILKKPKPIDLGALIG